MFVFVQRKCRMLLTLQSRKPFNTKKCRIYCYSFLGFFIFYVHYSILLSVIFIYDFVLLDFFFLIKVVYFTSFDVSARSRVPLLWNFEENYRLYFKSWALPFVSAIRGATTGKGAKGTVKVIHIK